MIFPFAENFKNIRINLTDTGMVWSHAASQRTGIRVHAVGPERLYDKVVKTKSSEGFTSELLQD